jgi:aspartyl-tRNA(Asn)/glutamyl-tRNA(Gln) amidotransferase subunit A
MTRTVQDSAYVMDTIASHDSKDPASAMVKPRKSSLGIKKGVKDLRIGIPRQFWEVPIEPEVKASVQKAIAVLQSLGAQVREVSWPNVFWAVTFGHLLSIADGSGAMGRLARQPNPSPEIRELLLHFPRIASGTLMSAADYLLAQRMRQRYLQDVQQIMSTLDLIAGPTMPMTAFPLDAREITIAGDTRNPEAFVPTYCRPYNTSGLPAVTVPCGFDSRGLPIGLQIAARPLQDSLVLRAAFAYEQATNWRTRRPPL